MSLSRGQVNPLGVLELRQLDFIPEHFTKLTIERNVRLELLNSWINYNLNSRYSVKESIIVNQSNKIIEVYEIGIEDPKEVTMLTIGCPYLHQTNKEIY
jgi:hypothetical protein